MFGHKYLAALGHLENISCQMIAKKLPNGDTSFFQKVNFHVKTAFDALTPGRQRAYLFFFSQPKQSKTREARIEKCMPQILIGKGLNDEWNFQFNRVRQI